MSRASPDNPLEPFPTPYTEHQDIMMHDDVEESATLAEPMTLEGAKQLAATSVVVPVSTPTTPSVVVTCASASPPPQLPLAISPLSGPTLSAAPHHHGPPTLTHHSHHHPSSAHSHHHHHHHHHLTSPPQHIQSPPPHLAVTTSPLTHHHHIWGPSSVVTHEDDDDDDQKDLPSTVDIQAIRDSPSPDPSASAQLVTINANWDSVEDQEQVEEDTDNEDSESEASDSDSDSRASSRTHSRSPSHSPSRVESRSPSNSRSESGSQESDSDSSGWSDDSSSNSDGDKKKDERMFSPFSKPLPRRKPQLTAAKVGGERLPDQRSTTADDTKTTTTKTTTTSINTAKTTTSTINTTTQLFCSASISPSPSRFSPVHSISSLPQMPPDKFFMQYRSPDHKFSSKPLLENISSSKTNILSTDGDDGDDEKEDEKQELIEKEKESKKRISDISTISNKNERLPNPMTMIGVFNPKSSRLTDPLNLNNSISETNAYNNPISTKSDNPSNESSIFPNQSEKLINITEDTTTKDQVSIIKNIPVNTVRKEETKTIGTDTPVFTKENDVLPNKKEVKKNSRKSQDLSPEERERRRRQKEQQLNREFDRLLFSTKSPPSKSSTDHQSCLLLSSDKTNIIHPKPSTININHIADIRTSKPATDIVNNISTLMGKEKSVCVKKEKYNITSENLIKSCVETQGTSKDFGDRRKDQEKSYKSHKAITDIKPKESHSEIEKKAPDKKTLSKELFLSNNGNNSDKSENIKGKVISQDVDKNINSISSEVCLSSGKLTDLSASDRERTEKVKAHDIGVQSKKNSLPVDQKNKNKTKSKIGDSSIVKDDSRTSLKVSQVFNSFSKCKLDETNHGCDQNKQKDFDKSKDENEERFVIIRPTIADLVKVRERRKSTDTEKVLSSSEKSKKGGSIYTETSSDSESSEELNEKIDLDTEQTQTFSVSESNFNQGRLTMKIAAMKMAKFGKTGLREVSSGAIPTRSDLTVPPSLETASVSMSFSPFRRPRNMAPKSNTEHCKVKTAAERKTYSDALPPSDSIRNIKRHRKKGSLVKGEMRVPAASIYQRGSGGIGGGSLAHHGLPGSSGGSHGHQPNMEDDEITISRLAHHFPQISLDTLTDDGLQELDQEDLAALLPDISSGSGHQDGSSVSLDDFTDEVDVSRDSDTEEGEDHASNDLPGDDDLPDVILREAIDSMTMSTGEDVAFSKFNSGLIADLDECSSRSIQHSQLHKSSQQHLRAVTKSPRADMPSRHRDDIVSEKKRNKGSRHHRHSTSGNEMPATQEDESEPPPMPELEQESYVSIDCNVSNVSPDSGIQSHTGSPMHHIGSPLQHHSPLYASSSTGKSVDSCGSSHHRPFSPTLSSQDSPPPPTLLPAVTPPHMLSSPKYDYDDPHSPPMPLLKIQVDLPLHYNEESAKADILKEQGTLKKRGPGRPKLESSDKPRRPRGRPKGSKGKRRAQNTNEEAVEVARLSDSEKEPNEGEYGIWKSELINERLSGENNGELVNEPSNNTKWNEEIRDLDSDDLPPPPEPIPPLKRGPGRPKKVPPVLEPSVPITDISHNTSSIVQTEHKADNCNVASDNYSSAKIPCATEELTDLPYKSKKSNKIDKQKSNSTDKRPVGRPRKNNREEDIELSQNVPTTVASKKCFSERIMHKIINEKVRNSEKSDKLSVRVEEEGSIAESHKGNDPYSFQELSTSHNTSDKWINTHKHNKQVGKVKHSKQGLVLEENKKRRGRKKELPAIFEKIYGTQESKPKNKNEQVRPTVVSSNLHSKEKHKKKKKKSKHFRSKHKNIVDPVFLADLEDLTSGLVQCSISKALSIPQAKSGEVLLPSIFRLRKFSLAVKKRKNEKPRTSDRESGTECDSGKDKSSKRKKKQQELPKQGRERTEANEQRLPLKKRHRHISTAVQPEFVKDDVKTADAILIKSCQPVNVAEKDFNKVDKQEKERNERLDNKVMKPYIFKSSPDTNKLIRSEPKSVKNVEESQKRLGYEVPFSSSSTIYEENNLTVKCTRDDEFLKVHQIIESRRPSESENLNTSEARIYEQHNSDKKEITSKEISEPTASSRTRTATTTPKKRHRLEASIEVSSLPSSATRATLYLSKGKHDKDSTKPTKDLGGSKNPVSRSPKNTIRDTYIKDGLSISQPKFEETIKLSSAVPESLLSDVKNSAEPKIKSASEVKYKSFNDSKLKYNEDYKIKNLIENKTKTRLEEPTDKMLIQFKNKMVESKPENMAKPTNEAKNKPPLENKVKLNDSKSRNLIEPKGNSVEEKLKLVVDSKSKCIEGKSNQSECKSKPASEKSVIVNISDDEICQTKTNAPSPRSKTDVYTIDNKQSSEQKSKTNVEYKHRSSNKSSAIDHSGKSSSSRNSSSESKNRLHNVDVKAKTSLEDPKDKPEMTESKSKTALDTKSRNVLDTTNKIDIVVKEPSTSKSLSKPIISTKSSQPSDMKVKNKDNDKSNIISDDKYRYEGKRKHRYRHLSDHRESSHVENAVTLQATAFEVKNSQNVEAKQKTSSSTDSVLNMYIDNRLKNTELRNTALDDNKLRRIAEVKLSPLRDEKSRIIESKPPSYDIKSKSHADVNDEIVKSNNSETAESRSFSPNKGKSKSLTDDKSKSPIGRKNRQKVEAQNKLSDELKSKTTYSDQQCQIISNDETKDVSKLANKFEKADPKDFESNKVINEEKHQKVSVEGNISMKTQAKISVEDKNQSLLEKKSFVEHKIKSRRFGYKEITSDKLDLDGTPSAGNLDVSKTTEKKLHCHSVEENIKCSIEEKGKSYIERKTSRRGALEEKAKSNHPKDENIEVTKEKALLESKPDSIVDENTLSCKTFIEHKIKKSLRKSNTEEKSKVTVEEKAEIYVEHKSKSARRTAIEEERTKVAIEEKVESFVEHKSKLGRRTATEVERTKIAVEEKIKSFVEHKSKSGRRTAADYERTKIAVEEKVESFVEHKSKSARRIAAEDEKTKIAVEEKVESFVEHKSKSARRTAAEDERTKIAVEEKVESFVEHKSKSARKATIEEERTKVAVEKKVESFVEHKSKSARRIAAEDEKTKIAVEEKVESFVEHKSKSARRTATEDETTKTAVEEKVESFVVLKSKSGRRTAAEDERTKFSVEEKVESFVEHKSKSARKPTIEEEKTKVAVEEKVEAYVESKSKSARRTVTEDERTKLADEEKVESFVEHKSKSARRTAAEDEKTKIAVEEKVESFVEHKSKSAKRTATEDERTKIAIEEKAVSFVELKSKSARRNVSEEEKSKVGFEQKAESYVQQEMRLSRKSGIEDKFEEKVGSYVQHKTKTRKSVIKGMDESKISDNQKPTIDKNKDNLSIENNSDSINAMSEQCISEQPLSLQCEVEAKSQSGRKIKGSRKESDKQLDESEQFNKITDTSYSSTACTPQPGPKAGESPLIEPAQIVDAEEKFKALLAKGTDTNIYNDTSDMTPHDIKINDSSENKVISSSSTENAVDECKMKNINEEFKSKVFEIIQQPIDGISHGSDIDSSIQIFPNEGSHTISLAAKENSGTHSDSDIPSEHEPLCESDQSGFMSDKEGPKQEIPVRIPQKRRKKKRELRSPLPKVADKPTPAEVADNIELPPPKKKKHKKRKANRTGFPTIKRKKPKPKPVIEESEYFTSEGVDGVVEIAPINIKPVECFESTDHIEESRYYKRENRKEMNPPLPSESLSASDDLETNKYEVSSSHFHDTDMLELKSSEDVIPKKPRPRGRPKKIVTSTEHHGTDIIVPKQLKESLRDRAALKNEPSEEEKNLEEETEKPSLAEILMHVATGIGSRTRRKRDLSEESLKYGSEFKRLKRHGEDEGEECDTVMMSSESMPSSEPPSGDESYRTMSAKRKVPRWKKKYLVAGLFSDYYKENESRKRNGEISQPKNKLTYDPEEHRHGLLPPPCYCRKWLREREIDFRLPYDLWWLHEHNMLPGRDVVPSWNYKKVKSNIYFDVRPNQNNSETQPCNCKRPTKPGEAGCGDDCINRMMFLECTTQTCPIADVCSNQPIQRHEYTALQRFMTIYKGWGMKAVDLIKAGTFIMEYVGEVVSEKEFKHRMQTKYVNDTHHYCLNLDRGMVIDGHRMGGDCRFVNHSCNPNCEMQKWYVKGEYRMALFSLQDIEQGTELTYDYNFSLFNPAEGQECKCGSENCRGVIGGKSQRVNGIIIDDKKKNLKKDMNKKRKRLATEENEMSLLARPQIAPIKPLSHQQQLFILARRCFLIRNLNKVRRSRDRLARGVPEKKPEEIIDPDEEPTRRVEKFQTHFTALNTARSVKTRRLAQAEDDPEMTRLAKLAQIFKDIFDKLVASRDAKDKPLATPFMSLPSKKKYLNYYTRVGEPIDLAIVEKNIMTGHYITAEAFDRDVMRLFANNLRYFGRNTEIGQMAVGLRRVYSECKLQFKPLLEEVLGEDQLPLAFANSSPNEEFEDEDVIRCVCNLHRDEGVMIQCERCLVWQHCDCMGVLDAAPEHYLCEECSPRLISPEVPMNPQPQEVPRDHKYFITLLRDNLQLKQGDSVYILRDRPNQKPGERRQPAYKLVKDVKPHDLLIFKIENLWIDEKGDKFAFGHHFLRPHETFHEPWRKFFPNEVIRSPLCEILSLDMIVNHCWVLDLNTYCRGRPIGSSEDHVYVCEYRVDKSARIFSKISKPKYPICTKPFAFITYQEKIRPQRTYTPHEVISNSRGRSSSSGASKDLVEEKVGGGVAGSSGSRQGSRENSSSRSSSGQRSTVASSSSNAGSGTNNGRSSRSREPPTPTPPEISTEQTLAAVRKLEDKPQKRAKKRARCNMVATKLLNLLPTKGAADLSYLLENNKRQRKKTAAFAS